MKKFLLWVAKVCNINLVEYRESVVLRNKTDYLKDGDHNINGDVYIKGNLVIDGNLDVTGNITCKTSKTI